MLRKCQCGTMMYCIDSRGINNHIRRRYECYDCKERKTTIEVVVEPRKREMGKLLEDVAKKPWKYGEDVARPIIDAMRKSIDKALEPYGEK